MIDPIASKVLQNASARHGDSLSRARRPKRRPRIQRQGSQAYPERISEPWKARRAEYLREVGRKEPDGF
jgi:hypothetical protein